MEPLLEPNPYMMRAVSAIQFRWPNDVVTTFRPCDLNADGEYGAHAFDRALDHWGKGPFAQRHMNASATYAIAHAGAWNVDAVYWKRYAYRSVNGFAPERIPADRVQHLDHCHIQFFPLPITAVPSGCPPVP